MDAQISRTIVPVSWEAFHHDARVLAKMLKDLREKSRLGPWKIIITITRGGLQPAGIVARELDIRVVETIGAILYDGQTKGESVTVVKPFSNDLVTALGGPLGRDLLVIDDLVDTGETARNIKAKLPRDVHYATLYAKPQGALAVNTCVRQYPQSSWIQFPWDKHLALYLEDSSPQLQLKLDPVHSAGLEPATSPV